MEYYELFGIVTFLNGIYNFNDWLYGQPHDATRLFLISKLQPYPEDLSVRDIGHPRGTVVTYTIQQHSCHDLKYNCP